MGVIVICNTLQSKVLASVTPQKLTQLHREQLGVCWEPRACSWWIFCRTLISQQRKAWKVWQSTLSVDVSHSALLVGGVIWQRMTQSLPWCTGNFSLRYTVTLFMYCLQHLYSLIDCMSVLLFNMWTWKRQCCLTWLSCPQNLTKVICLIVGISWTYFHQLKPEYSRLNAQYIQQVIFPKIL